MNKYFNTRLILFLFLLSLLLYINNILDIKDQEYRELQNKVYVKVNTNKELIADIFTVDLEVNNIQMYEEDNVYRYLIKIDSKEDIYKVLIGNKEEYIELNDNKEAYVEIGSNESFVIKDIPIDTKYSLVQESREVASLDNSLTNVYEGVTSLDNKVYFYNTKNFINNPNTDDRIVIIMVLFIIVVILNGLLNKVKVRIYE